MTLIPDKARHGILTLTLAFLLWEVQVQLTIMTSQNGQKGAWTMVQHLRGWPSTLLG